MSVYQNYWDSILPIKTSPHLSHRSVVTDLLVGTSLSCQCCIMSNVKRLLLHARPTNSNVWSSVGGAVVYSWPVRCHDVRCWRPSYCANERRSYGYDAHVDADQRWSRSIPTSLQSHLTREWEQSDVSFWIGLWSTVSRVVLHMDWLARSEYLSFHWWRYLSISFHPIFVRGYVWSHV